MSRFIIDRRNLIRAGAETLATAAFVRPSVASARTVKIGLVVPQTGPLAIFSE